MATAASNKPTAARLVNPSANLWAMDSFTGERSYIIDLAHSTCTCPHYKKRLAGSGQCCKHLIAAKAQARWVSAVEKARRCSDADLLKLGEKYLADAIISGAIIYVQHERRRQAKRRFRDDDMQVAYEQGRMIDLPKWLAADAAAERPPIGTSVKLSGPVNDQEAFHAQR